MNDSHAKVCPYCSGAIGFGAEVCPNCGAPVPVGGPGFGTGGSSPFGPFVPSAPYTPFPGNPPQASGGWGTGPTPGQPGFGPQQSFGVRPSPAGGRKASAALVWALVIALLVLAPGAFLVIRAMGAGGCGGGGAQEGPIVLGQPVQGELTTFRHNRSYELVLTQPTAVTIALQSDFDNYLELYAQGSSTPMLTDDDSGGSLNALLQAQLPAGTYRILVRGFSENATGPFTLTTSGFPMGGGLGSGLQPPMGAFAPQSYQGMVTSVSGAAPVSGGAPCTIAVTPSQGEYNCRFVVQCAGTVIYGAGDAGYNTCLVTTGPDGSPVFEAHDTGGTVVNGDPIFDVLTATRQLTVADQIGGTTWSVTVQFVPGGQLTGPPTAI